MSYNYRCKHRLKSKDGKQCDTRITLKHPVEWYIRTPKCPSCGTEISYNDIWSKERNKRELCNCDGYHYPHKNNSKWCIHYEGVLTDEDYEGRR